VTEALDHFLWHLGREVAQALKNEKVGIDPFRDP
jgi:hypothetical protein